MSRPQIIGKIVDRMLQFIVRGRWPADSVLPAVRKLAAELGVSQDTVLAVIRRLAEQGLIEVRQRRPIRVLPGAEEKARQLLLPKAKVGRSSHVAILMSDAYRPLTKITFYADLVGKIIREFERLGLRTSLVWWPAREQLAVAETLLRADYGAAVFVGVRTEYLAGVFFLHERKFPLLIYNYETPGLQQPTVIEDLYGAGQKIADVLFKLGHRNLCLVGKSMSDQEAALSHRGMSRGWADYLADQGLLETCTMPVYIPWEYRRDPFCQTFWEAMQGPHRPTALIFANSFWAAHFLLSQPEASRLRVPEQLSLATFGSMAAEQVPSWCPPLTNLDIDHARTAQCMVEVVQKMLADEPYPPVLRMPLKLEITESIGPVP